LFLFDYLLMKFAIATCMLCLQNCFHASSPGRASGGDDVHNRHTGHGIRNHNHACDAIHTTGDPSMHAIRKN